MKQKFDNYTKQKNDELETRHHVMLKRHKEFLTQMINKELGRLDTISTSTQSKMIDDTKAVTKSQQETSCGDLYKSLYSAK